MEINKIYNEDCLEGMKKIPDGSIDFVCTDLPFGATNCEWDKKIDLQKFWEQVNRITKVNAAIALFASGKFLIELGSSNLKNYRYEWVWEKPNGTNFFSVKKVPLNVHENILVFYKKFPTYNPQYRKGKAYSRKHKNYRGGVFSAQKRVNNPTDNDGEHYYPRNVIKFPAVYGGKTERFHNSQKPVELIEYLIKTYTNEGETVLDATIGSGTTAVAAINTGRNFIGFELDENYFEIANERIAKVLNEKSSLNR